MVVMVSVNFSKVVWNIKKFTSPVTDTDTVMLRLLHPETAKSQPIPLWQPIPTFRTATATNVRFSYYGMLRGLLTVSSLGLLLVRCFGLFFLPIRNVAQTAASAWHEILQGSCQLEIAYIIHYLDLEQCVP